MDEQAKFNQWWESKGVNSVILRAQAWSAWLARAEADQQQPQPAEDTAEWVIQDRVPVRRGIDRINWVENSVDTSCEPFDLSIGKMHGYVNRHGASLHVYCRRCDLPKVEQPEQCRIVCQASKADGIICPHESCDIEDGLREAQKVEQAEQWPKYYTGIVSGTAYIKRLSSRECVVVETDGTETAPMRWADWDERKRTEITEAEAMALLDQPEPDHIPDATKKVSNEALELIVHLRDQMQVIANRVAECERVVFAQTPQRQKKPIRLWIDPDCNIHAGPKGDRDLELHYDHETRQFYTEETR